MEGPNEMKGRLVCRSAGKSSPKFDFLLHSAEASLHLFESREVKRRRRRREIRGGSIPEE